MLLPKPLPVAVMSTDIGNRLPGAISLSLSLAALRDSPCGITRAAHMYVPHMHSSSSSRDTRKHVQEWLFVVWCCLTCVCVSRVWMCKLQVWLALPCQSAPRVA